MHVRKHDVSGSVLWSKDIDLLDHLDGGFSANETMVADNSGGFHMVLSAGTTQYTDPLGSDSDTTICHIAYMHLDQNGELIGTKLFRRELIHSFYSIIPTNLSIYTNEAGGLGIVITGGFDINWTEIIDLNADGSTNWIMGYDIPSLPTSGPRVIRPKVNGGYYMLNIADGPVDKLEMLSIAANGAISWSKAYNYTNSVYGSRYNDFTTDGIGRIHAVGHVALPTGDFRIMPIISPSGVLERVDLYRPGGFRESEKIFLGPSGDRFVFSRSSQSWATTGTMEIMIADTLGNDASLKQRKEVLVGDNYYYGDWGACDVKNGRMLIADAFYKQHAVLSYLTKRESVLDMDMNDLTSCFFSDTTNAHTSVPLSIMTTQDIATTWYDASQLWTWTNADTLTITDVTPPTFSDLCSFAVGINKNPTSTEQQLLYPTLLTAGQPLTITADNVQRIEVWNTSGQLIQKHSVSSDRSVPTNTLAPGMYAVKAYGAVGSVLGTTRLVVD